jgi:hypothetical protein
MSACAKLGHERRVSGDPRREDLAKLPEQFGIHANQITQWKGQPLEGTPGSLGEAKTEPAHFGAMIPREMCKFLR